MSMVDLNAPSVAPVPEEVGLPDGGQPLHRLGIVRRRQGVSRRTVARRLNTDVSAVREQEKATTDLSLSTLYKWQKALEVPVAELLVESEAPLSDPVQKRAQLVRLMKTALSIRESAREPSVQRMAETLVGQLMQMMPELEHVSPWHAVGQRRRLDEYGVAAQRRLSCECFIDRE